MYPLESSSYKILPTYVGNNLIKDILNPIFTSRYILGENYDMRGISEHYAVARAQHFIEQHFAEEITVKKLAKLCNISVSTFTRIFKKELYMTPIEYLIEVRLQQAKKLLRRGDIPITQVALRCGFNSSSHLASSFQRVLHMTPSEYRKIYCK